MNREEIDRILRQTLEDRRLSRGEKRTLGETFEDLIRIGSDPDFLRSRIFEIASGEVRSKEGRELLAWVEDVVKVLGNAALSRAPEVSSNAYFEPKDDCSMKIADLFSEVRHKVDVCVFTITHDFIASSILGAHRRGVSIRIITDDYKVQDRGSDIIRLADAGIPVRIDKSSAHMHHKFALFDGMRVLTGSYNWTRSAAEENLENIIVTDDPGLVPAFQVAFDDMWERFG